MKIKISVLLAIFLILVLLLTYALVFSKNDKNDSAANTYTIDSVVCNIDNDLISAEDASGNVWNFYGQNYSIGDRVTLIMNNNNTADTIYDDIIINVS